MSPGLRSSRLSLSPFSAARGTQRPARPTRERSAIEKRATTCGSTYYSTAQVNAAANAACKHVRAGTQAGSSNYPHRLQTTTRASTSRRQAPGREFPPEVPVVSTPEITHTGASGNNFVGCSGTTLG
ncbi:guanyl-specific ribonuclease F1 [Verticillium alfalfae VaMs.102]|uniref:Guanyl-specific ribonuclease F1 n=1 Tax=Verticillium alfalfae (strain VaMs.102 / ATCC MYA-4576 / FGSC 10136) TaxID=526221 RepID=C9SSH5_VERA1|nr:guanyl-specific ribonuclease F1 [Verticillium alfalfae VaMs.102]EEY21740.1 guanyl-specific ribonuclease F1 [Verticillium alfalfae VaMs.102]